MNMVNVEEIKLPYVPVQLVEHLEETFTRTYCMKELAKDISNNDELIGMIMGVDSIISYLKSIAFANEDSQ